MSVGKSHTPNKNNKNSRNKYSIIQLSENIVINKSIKKYMINNIINKIYDKVDISNF